jgi:hypothetical protein
VNVEEDEEEGEAATQNTNNTPNNSCPVKGEIHRLDLLQIDVSKNSKYYARTKCFKGRVEKIAKSLPLLNSYTYIYIYLFIQPVK